MSQSYYISSGVLDATAARRRVPQNYPPPESCVAPKDVFSDYENVMANMRARNHNGRSFYDDDFSTDGSSPKTPYSTQMDDDDMYDDDDDDEDYPSNHGGRSKPRAAPRDMTNTHPGMQCNYVDPNSRERCDKINRCSQEAARHWRSCHLYKEAKSMILGLMPVGRGAAITSKEQLEKVRPQIECQRCGALITRSDAMRRHVKTNCR